jgi:hypothetical protein
MPNTKTITRTCEFTVEGPWVTDLTGKQAPYLLRGDVGSFVDSLVLLDPADLARVRFFVREDRRPADPRPEHASHCNAWIGEPCDCHLRTNEDDERGGRR